MIISVLMEGMVSIVLVVICKSVTIVCMMTVGWSRWYKG